INLLEQAADLFDAAGYEAQAADRYARALSADGESIVLKVKYARFLERARRYGDAHTLNGKALRALLLRQPPPVAPGQAEDASLTVEYREHYVRLLQGYLATWPATHALQDAELASMEGMLEHEAHDAAARIERGAPAEFESHLRLTLMSRALRRI